MIQIVYLQKRIKGNYIMAKQITESFPEERDDIILDVLKRQGKIRVTEVCDILSIAPSTARLLLQSMQEKVCFSVLMAEQFL